MVKLMSTAFAAIGLSALTGIALFSSHHALAQGAILPDEGFAQTPAAQTPAAQTETVTADASIRIDDAVFSTSSDLAPNRSPRPSMRQAQVTDAAPVVEQVTMETDDLAFVQPAPATVVRRAEPVRATPQPVARSRQTANQYRDPQAAARKKLFLPYMTGIAR